MRVWRTVRQRLLRNVAFLSSLLVRIRVWFSLIFRAWVLVRCLLVVPRNRLSIFLQIRCTRIRDASHHMHRRLSVVVSIWISVRLITLWRSIIWRVPWRPLVRLRVIVGLRRVLRRLHHSLRLMTPHVSTWVGSLRIWSIARLLRTDRAWPWVRHSSSRMGVWWILLVLVLRITWVWGFGLRVESPLL